jgi:citrate synthase
MATSAGVTDQAIRQPGRGLADVVAAATALSDTDGRAGRLSYRGYDIRDLAGRVSFEEIVHLLHRGSLPTADELGELSAQLAAGRQLSALVAASLPAISAAAAPMEALRSLVSLAAHDDPDKGSNSAEANRRKAVRLVAQQPVLVAAYQAARRGEVPAAPDPSLGLAATLLSQLSGRSAEPAAVAALDECLVLHADHTMNAPTFACRVCAATNSDMHSAVVAGIATLAGPLHVGASQAVISMLESLPPDDVENSVRARLQRGERLVGFGHRVYRTEDPRATRLRELARRLGDLAGDTSYLELSLAVERAVMEVAGLYPNVDFYAAAVYRLLGIPTELFLPVFTVARMAGWTAHVMEQHADNRLIRPDSEYIGQTDQQWVPIEQR